ncbi:MAG: L,D-transpeptidase family protein [Lentisphaeria bacterium]|nr:L,D-transpeptidase family protein [Lentisphaeria bacterium]
MKEREFTLNLSGENMNTMYKIPLIVFLTIVLVGLCYIGWHSWKPPVVQEQNKPKVASTKKPAATDSKRPPELTEKPPVKAEAKGPMEPPVVPGDKPVEVKPAQPQVADKPQPPKPPVTEPVAPKADVKPAEPVAKPPAPQPPVVQPVAVAAQPPVQEEGMQNFNMLLETAQAQYDAKTIAAARPLIHKALQDPKVVEYGKAWFRATDLLNKVNSLIMNSPSMVPEKKRYVIQKGDNLTRIAYKLKTTVQALQRINKLSKTNSTIHPGDSLKYIEGTWSIKVSKSQYTLSLYLNGQLYRVYRVSVGAYDQTPVGVFEILNKSREPTWAPPGRDPLPYGHPENIIGTRWMGLTPVEGTDTDMGIRGYGIHGTIDPGSIGQAASAGCVRMRNEEVEELFDFIPEPNVMKTRVTIVE